MNTEIKTPQLEDGYTQIAHQTLENLCKINLSAYQIRVLLAIIRKTYGWGKKEDFISISQLVEITGIHKAHVSRTKKELLQRKLVTSSGNKIGFQKDRTLWKELPRQVTIKKVTNLGLKVTNPGITVTSSGNKKLPVQADTIDNINTITKDTIQKIPHSQKIKNITLEEKQVIADRYQVPLAFVESKHDDLLNWHEQRPQKNRRENYLAVLRGWVKRDALQVIDKHNDKQAKNNKYRVVTIKE